MASDTDCSGGGGGTNVDVEEEDADDDDDAEDEGLGEIVGAVVVARRWKPPRGVAGALPGVAGATLRFR